MNKEKLSQIVEGVYKATINGSLKWKLSENIFNSDTRHKCESISSDGVTKFYCEVSLTSNMVLDLINPLIISNPNMIDDGVYLYQREYPLVIDIQKFLYNKIVLPNINIMNQDRVMDDILKGIDVSEYRDKKLDDILGSIEEKVEEKKEPKKSLIRKIFGK